MTSLPALKMCKMVGCSGIAITTRGYCSSCAEYKRVKSYNSRPKVPKRAKTPVGVELEMFGPHCLSSISTYACRDASLPPGGVEIKLVAESTKIGPKAADVVQRARIAGGEVNDRCGFHVHLDRESTLPIPTTFSDPNVNAKELELLASPENPHRRYEDMLAYKKEVEKTRKSRLAKFALYVQDYFFSIMPPSRQNNVYCRRITNESDLPSHHSWISLSYSVPTVEIRIHGGTLNPWKVLAWIDVCNILREKINTYVKTGNDNDLPSGGKFRDICPMNSLAYTYLKQRERNPSLRKFGF